MNSAMRNFFLGNTDELLCDDRFFIDRNFFNWRLKFRSIRKYELVVLKLNDIKLRINNRAEFLCVAGTYRYLTGNDSSLKNTDKKKYDALIKNIEKDGYDRRRVIIVDFENCIEDGMHRASYLLYKYGGEYEVPVLRLDLCRRNALNRFMRHFYKCFVGFQVATTTDNQ